jgi:zinc transport system substrate-binding protein
MRIVVVQLWRLLLALLLVAPLTACAATNRSGEQVVVSFYPLQYVAQRIVGAHAEVTNLTKPGVEPHELELRPSQIADISSADVVLYEKGLAPSFDDAVAQNKPEHVVDTTTSVPLRKGDGGLDPHFWQDPTLLARAASAFTRAMATDDPDHAAAYRANDAKLQADLTTLDQELEQGLAQCRTRTLVVSHDAFEYYGRRYDLDVRPIAGLSPDAEPSAKHLAQLADLARTKGITTIFSETLASPKLADTLASDVGITTAVLDPIEGLSSKDPHADYLSLMRQNLAAIQKAGGCT